MGLSRHHQVAARCAACAAARGEALVGPQLSCRLLLIHQVAAAAAVPSGSSDEAQLRNRSSLRLDAGGCGSVSGSSDEGRGTGRLPAAGSPVAGDGNLGSPSAKALRSWQQQQQPTRHPPERPPQPPHPPSPCEPPVDSSSAEAVEGQHSGA